MEHFRSSGPTIQAEMASMSQMWKMARQGKVIDHGQALFQSGRGIGFYRQDLLKAARPRKVVIVWL